MSKKRDFRLQSEITRRIEAEAKLEITNKILEARDQALAATPAPAAAPPPAPPKTLRQQLAGVPAHLHAAFVLAHEADIMTTGWDKPPAQRSE